MSKCSRFFAATTAGLLVIGASVGVTERAWAARPACTASRVGRVFGSGATAQTCRRVRVQGRASYLWVVNITTSTPRGSSGGGACLEGTWDAPRAVAYWQAYFEQKTGGGQLFKIVSGQKSITFRGGQANISGIFELSSVPIASDPGGPTISGKGAANWLGTYHVSSGGLVADTVSIDDFLDIKLFLNGSPMGVVPKPAGFGGFVPGQTTPFQCAGDRLTILEPGASGTVSVEYRRV